MNMFAVHNLRHAYNGREVLNLPEWEAAQGEHWLVLGPSGCGKTTLLHALAGLIRPDQGDITVSGNSLTALAGEALDRYRGHTIGIVLQKLHLIDALTVLDNLLLAQRLARQPVDREAARVALHAVGLLARERAYPHTLSSGEAQRLAIARAVVNRPRLILADEPTSSLDDGNAARVLDLIAARARDCDATLVVATHDSRIKSQIHKRIELGAAA
jgi:putative ABC transport system ATP-binding protein